MEDKFKNFKKMKKGFKKIQLSSEHVLVHQNSNQTNQSLETNQGGYVANNSQSEEVSLSSYADFKRFGDNGYI